MEPEYNLISVLRTLYKSRKPIIGITGAAAVLSLVVSFLVPVYYNSSTTFYAASQDFFKPEKVFGTSNSDMYYYGGGEDIERILTVAQSNELADLLIDSFNLYEHYKIDPDAPKAAFKVREKFFDQYNILRTKYDALELSIEDRSPEIAAALVNSARNKINEIVTGMIKGGQYKLIRSFENSINAKQTRLEEVVDSLMFYQSKFGIYNSGEQSAYLAGRATQLETKLVSERAKLLSLETARSAKLRDSVAVIRARIKGFESELELLNSDTLNSRYNLDRFNLGRGKVEVLDDAYRKAVNQLSIDKERLKQYQAGYALDVSAIHVVEAGEVPLVKSRPKKSLIILSSTFIAFLLSVLGVLLIEAYRGIDWQKIFRDG